MQRQTKFRRPEVQAKNLVAEIQVLTAGGRLREKVETAVGVSLGKVTPGGLRRQPKSLGMNSYAAIGRH